MINDKEFIAKLLTEFPDLRTEVEDEIVVDLLYAPMGCFTRYTENAINDGDYQRVKKCFQFADRILAQADESVANAIYVSFLEGRLFYGDPRYIPKALSLMPPALKKAWEEINAGWDLSYARKRWRRLKEVEEFAKKGEKSIPELVSAMGERDAQTQCIAVGALIEIGLVAVPNLIEALKTSSTRVRACEVLMHLGSGAKAAVPALIRVLKDKYRTNREYAAWALGAIGPDARSALPALLAAFDNDEPFRKYAYEAIEKIAPESLPRSYVSQG